MSNFLFKSFEPLNLASEVVRELPIPAYAFGIIAFAVFAFLLYIVLRLDK
jgi:hypothetical protein